MGHDLGILVESPNEVGWCFAAFRCTNARLVQAMKSILRGYHFDFAKRLISARFQLPFVTQDEPS